MATANLGVRIVLQDSASAGLNSLSAGLGRLGYQFGVMSQLWNSFTPLQQGLAVTTAASGLAFAGLFTILKDVTTAGEELQTALTNVSIAVQGADERTDDLRNTLIALDNQSIYSLTDISNGFIALGEHGQTAADIIDEHVGEAMTTLAEAIQSGPVPAANLLSVSLQVMGADSQQAADYADTLTGAFYNGIPSVEGLQSAITAAAPEARKLGVSFQDLVTMLDILGKSLGSGEEAGVALRNMLKDLTAPTNTAAKALASIGVIAVENGPKLQEFISKLGSAGGTASTAAENFDGSVGSLQKLFQAAQKVGLAPLDQDFYQWAIANGFLNDKLFDSSGKFLGLQNAVQQLGQAIRGLPPAEQADVLTKIFNIKGSKGIQTLVDDLGRFNTEWQTTWNNINSSDAGAAADKQTGTLAGAIERLKSSSHSLAELIGSTNIPTLTNLANALEGVVTKLQNMPEHTRANIAQFLLIGTAVSGAVFGLSSLGFGFSTLDKTIGPLLGPLGSMLGHFKPLGPAIEGVLGPLDLFGRGLFKSIGAMGGMPFALLQSGLSSLLFPLNSAGSGAGFLSKMVGLLSGGFFDMGAGVGALLPALGGLAGTIASVAIPVVAIIGVIAIIILLFTKFRQQGMEIANMFQTAFAPVFKTVAGVIMQAVHSITQAWQQAQPTLKPAMDDLVKGFKAAMPVLVFFGKIVGGVIAGLVHLIAGFVVGIIKALGPIINVFSNILKAIGDIGKIVVAVFHGDFGSAFKYVGDLVTHIFSIFKNYFAAIYQIVAGLVTGVINFFKGLFETLLGHSIVWDIVKGIQLAFNMIAAVGQLLLNIFIMPVLNMFKLLWAGIGAGINLGISLFEGLLNHLGVFGAWVKNSLVEPIKNAFNSFWDSVGAGIDRVIGFFNNFSSNVRGALRSVLGPIETFLSGLTNVPLVGGVFNGALNILHSIHLAQGGIAMGPTFAMIGEGHEPEAVIPLSKLGQLLDERAGGFGGSRGGDVHNHIYLGNKEVADIVVNGLTGRLRSNGFARRFR